MEKEEKEVIDREIERETNVGRDDLDRYPNRCHVTNWDVFVLIISILSHIIDVALDINLAYRYYSEGEMINFSLTAVFILFPAFVNTFISVRMYVLNEDTTASSRMAVKKWAVRIFVLLFQLAPIMRYCDSLDYALKSRRAEKKGSSDEQRKYYLLMLKEDSDVALLRVFECFLEAAPQQILQITIVLVDRAKGQSTIQLIHQFGSIVSSLLSMAWSMASYHRSIRFIQSDKSNLTWGGTLMQFLWHFNVTVSRILSISVAASLFPLLVAAASALHWLSMTAWLTLFERRGERSPGGRGELKARVLETVFCSILGLVYIFTYLTPSEGSTRNRYLIYYPICFVENLLGVALWGFLSPLSTRDTWYFLPVAVMGVAPFLVGILFMMIYYEFFHPETNSTFFRFGRRQGRGGRGRCRYACCGCYSPYEGSPYCPAEIEREEASTQTSLRRKDPTGVAQGTNVLHPGSPGSPGGNDPKMISFTTSPEV